MSNNQEVEKRLKEEFEEKFDVCHLTNAANITPSSDPYDWTEFSNGDERDLPTEIFKFFLSKISSTQKQTREETIDAAIEVVWKKKNQGILVPIPCPDGLMGCLVAHFERRFTEKDLNDVLSALSVLKNTQV